MRERAPSCPAIGWISCRRGRAGRCGSRTSGRTAAGGKVCGPSPWPCSADSSVAEAGEPRSLRLRSAMRQQRSTSDSAYLVHGNGSAPPASTPPHRPLGAFFSLKNSAGHETAVASPARLGPPERPGRPLCDAAGPMVGRERIGAHALPQPARVHLNDARTTCCVTPTAGRGGTAAHPWIPACGGLDVRRVGRRSAGWKPAAGALRGRSAERHTPSAEIPACALHSAAGISASGNRRSGG